MKVEFDAKRNFAMGMREVKPGNEVHIEEQKNLINMGRCVIADRESLEHIQKEAHKALTWGGRMSMPPEDVLALLEAARMAPDDLRTLRLNNDIIIGPTRQAGVS